MPDLYVAISLILCVLMYFAVARWDFPWFVRLILAAIPLVLAYIFGLFGLVGSGILVGAVYKTGS